MGQNEENGENWHKKEKNLESIGGKVQKTEKNGRI